MTTYRRPTNAIDLQEHGRIILAHGEATGHCHEILETGAVINTDLPAAQYFEDPHLGARVLLVDRPVTLTHQEHDGHRLYPDGHVEKLVAGAVVQTESYPAPVRQGDVFLDPIAPGAWKASRQSEYAPEEIRQVLD